MNRTFAAVAMAATLAIPLATSALAQPGPYDGRYGRGPHYDRGRYDRGHDYHRGNGGAAVGGALLGLGIGALIGGAVVASQPPPYRPPPPVYYPPPPPNYYAPRPPAVYYGN